MPAGATLVKPETDADRTATRLLLNWISELVAVANENEWRAVKAKDQCG